MGFEIGPKSPLVGNTLQPATGVGKKTQEAPQQRELNVPDAGQRASAPDAARPENPLDGAFVAQNGRRPRRPIAQSALEDASVRTTVDTQGRNSRADLTTTPRDRVGFTSARGNDNDTDRFSIYEINPNLPVYVEFNNRNPSTFVVENLPNDIAEATDLTPGGAYVFVNNGSIPGGDNRNIIGVFQ